MKIIEREGKTTPRIIEAFMKEFNVTLDDFKFEVIDKGTTSFLNLFGSKPARIKFTLADSTESVHNFTEELLKKMNCAYGKIDTTIDDDTYLIKIIDAQDPGHIIGKEAKLLNSIQHILNQVVNRQEKSRYRVRVDVDGYRERRKDALLKKVRSITEKVKKRDKSITLEPMHAANRRIVHQFVETDPQIKTMTVGQGEFKRVVILPANKAKAKSKPSHARKRPHKNRKA